MGSSFRDGALSNSQFCDRWFYILPYQQWISPLSNLHLGKFRFEYRTTTLPFPNPFRNICPLPTVWPICHTLYRSQNRSAIYTKRRLHPSYVCRIRTTGAFTSLRKSEWRSILLPKNASVFIWPVITVLPPMNMVYYGIITSIHKTTDSAPVSLSNSSYKRFNQLQKAGSPKFREPAFISYFGTDYSWRYASSWVASNLRMKLKCFSTSDSA